MRRDKTKNSRTYLKRSWHFLEYLSPHHHLRVLAHQMLAQDEVSQDIYHLLIVMFLQLELLVRHNKIWMPPMKLDVVVAKAVAVVQAAAALMLLPSSVSLSPPLPSSHPSLHPSPCYYFLFFL